MIKTKVSDQIGIEVYFNELIHSWINYLLISAAILFPVFCVLDMVVIEKLDIPLLTRLAIYRLVAVVILLAHFFFLKRRTPGPNSFLHGYFTQILMTIVISFIILELGGISSPYYAGIALVIFGHVIIPWKAIHAVISGILSILIYLFINIEFGPDFPVSILVNNVYFLGSSVILAGIVNLIRFELLKKEFFLRTDLKNTRDALWGEMELAQRIQTSLLPEKPELKGYEIIGYMKTADEVGGDYYDIIRSENRQFAVIGDVSGHGVSSGLIMMMAQTILHTIIQGNRKEATWEILSKANETLSGNILKLKESKYMTMTLMELEQNGNVKYSGAHLDSLVYRKKTDRIERFKSHGYWLGMEKDISIFLTEQEARMEEEDILLLYTDGVTEAIGPDGNLFGSEKL
ncbi:MAG: SpoIIE family protein phosphatase, partial [Leptospira sp.]|nr:SpoIIE family protein phosphatase [Leptospira sp.]